MTRAHWELHVQASMDDNPGDAQLQRQCASLLLDLATVREGTDRQVRDELDTKQANKALSGRDAGERDEIRTTLLVSSSPTRFIDELERRIEIAEKTNGR